MTIAALILLLLAGLGGAIWLFVQLGNQPWLVRTLIALLPITAMTMCFYAWGSAAVSPTWTWNSVKLVPTFAMTHGLPMYSDPSNGVMTGGSDGPLAALWVLPASLAKTPTNAITIGATINMLTIALPILWLAIAAVLATRTRTTRATTSIGHFIDHQALLLAATAWVAGMWLILSDDELRTLLLGIGGEAVSSGLILCSIAVLLGPPRMWRIITSGLLLACAVAARPAALPAIAAAPPIFMLLGERRAALMHLAASVGGVLAWLIGSSAVIGFDRLWFHCITLPLHPAWKIIDPKMSPSALPALWRSILDSLTSLWSYIGIAAVLVLAIRYLGGELRPARRPAALLILTAMLLWPSCIWSGACDGTPSSAAAVTQLFLVVAIVALIIELRTISSPSFAPFLAASAIALWIWPEQILSKHHIERTIAQINHRYENPAQIAFDFEKHNPASVYFPWSPLSVFMASGKLYHDEPGIIDRSALDGDPRAITTDALRAHLPDAMSVIAFPAQAPGTQVLRYFPTAQGPLAATQLPMFTVHVNVSSTQIAMPTIPQTTPEATPAGESGTTGGSR